MEIVTDKWFKYQDNIWGDFGDALEMYQAFHPSVVFLKTLKRNACVLDVGAGNGDVSVFRDWIKPSRKDLKFFAYDLELGNKFDTYDGYEIGWWPKEKPDFDGRQFDAIFSSHFIAHIDNSTSFIEWSLSRLNPDGCLYLEWPSPNSMHQPRNTEFHKHDIPLVISNYKDDAAHMHSIPDKEKIKSALTKNNVAFILQEGVISNPYFEEEVLAHFVQKKENDKFALTMAYQSRTYWAQYLIAKKMKNNLPYS